MGENEFKLCIERMKQEYRDLAKKAERFDSYYEFAASNDAELEEFLDYFRRVQGFLYKRSNSFNRFRRIECYAYEEAHPHTMWKVFSYKGKELCAYTLYGEGTNEEKSTRELHAYDLSVSVDEIEVGYRYQRREAA